MNEVIHLYRVLVPAGLGQPAREDLYRIDPVPGFHLFRITNETAGSRLGDTDYMTIEKAERFLTDNVGGTILEAVTVDARPLPTYSPKG
jgi:hypothetical protein